MDIFSDYRNQKAFPGSVSVFSPSQKKKLQISYPYDFWWQLGKYDEKSKDNLLKNAV